MANVSTKVVNEVAPEVQAIAEDHPDWVWVHIPDRDLLDYPFTGIGINLVNYGPGDHKVPPDIAKEINERLAIAKAADLRIYNGRRDMKSLIELVKNNPSYSYFDPNQPMPKN